MLIPLQLLCNLSPMLECCDRLCHRDHCFKWCCQCWNW